jgi:hypothetical protein
VSFLNSHIITRFKIPECLVFHNASYFSSLDMNIFTLEKVITLKYSASYYPRGNGLSESTNKNLIKIIKRTVSGNHKNWNNALYKALWDDKVTPKASQFELDFSLIACMASSALGSVWYLDSGSSFHMTGDKEIFSDLEEKDLKMHIEMDNDGRYSVTSIGTITF